MKNEPETELTGHTQEEAWNHFALFFSETKSFYQIIFVCHDNFGGTFEPLQLPQT